MRLTSWRGNTQAIPHLLQAVRLAHWRPHWQHSTLGKTRGLACACPRRQWPFVPDETSQRRPQGSQVSGSGAGHGLTRPAGTDPEWPACVSPCSWSRGVGSVVIVCRAPVPTVSLQFVGNGMVERQIPPFKEHGVCPLCYITQARTIAANKLQPLACCVGDCNIQAVCRPMCFREAACSNTAGPRCIFKVSRTACQPVLTPFSGLNTPLALGIVRVDEGCCHRGVHGRPAFPRLATHQ